MPTGLNQFYEELQAFQDEWQRITAPTATLLKGCDKHPSIGMVVGLAALTVDLDDLKLQWKYTSIALLVEGAADNKQQRITKYLCSLNKGVQRAYNAEVARRYEGCDEGPLDEDLQDFQEDWQAITAPTATLLEGCDKHPSIVKLDELAALTIALDELKLVWENTSIALLVEGAADNKQECITEYICSLNLAAQRAYHAEVTRRYEGCAEEPVQGAGAEEPVQGAGAEEPVQGAEEPVQGAGAEEPVQGAEEPVNINTGLLDSMFIIFLVTLLGSYVLHIVGY